MLQGTKGEIEKKLIINKSRNNQNLNMNKEKEDRKL
jgi:hypothetical protein